ncbi:MAG: hypothetical protein ABI347_08805 [Nitrososphaera sp.]
MIELIEAVGYVAVGFAGTLAAMEAAWKVAKKRDAPHLVAKVK